MCVVQCLHGNYTIPWKTYNIRHTFTWITNFRQNYREDAGLKTGHFDFLTPSCDHAGFDIKHYPKCLLHLKTLFSHQNRDVCTSECLNLVPWFSPSSAQFINIFDFHSAANKSQARLQCKSIFSNWKKSISRQ